jgi:uncharacterized protein DUF1918
VGGVARRVRAHEATGEERTACGSGTWRSIRGGPPMRGVPRIGPSRGGAGSGARQAELTWETLGVAETSEPRQKPFSHLTASYRSPSPRPEATHAPATTFLVRSMCRPIGPHVASALHVGGLEPHCMTSRSPPVIDAAYAAVSEAASGDHPDRQDDRRHRTACMSPPVPGNTWGGLRSSRPEEATMVEVGDHVLVESEKVGSVTRSGVVTAIDGRLITVRWDTGSESVFVPSAGSLQVTGHESAVREADSS